MQGVDGLRVHEVSEIVSRICAEISQEGNLNAYSRLFILDNSLVAKVFCGNAESTAKNLFNLRIINRQLSGHPFPELALPSAFLSHRGKTIGYLMPYFSGTCLYEALADPVVPFTTKVRWFNSLESILQRLPTSIHIGDLHGNNVLVGHSGEVRLIDVDGFSVDAGYSMTCPMHYEKDLIRNLYADKYFFSDGTTKIGYNTDVFCLFSLFLDFLLDGYNPYYFCHEWFDAFLRYLRAKGVDNDVVQMFAQVTEKKDNYLVPSCFDAFLCVDSGISYVDFLSCSGLLEAEKSADAFLQNIIF